MSTFLLVRTIFVRPMYDGPWPGLFADDDPVQLGLVCLYAIVYVLLPAGLTSRWSSSGMTRMLTRLAIPAFAFALSFSGWWTDYDFDSWSVGQPLVFGETVTSSGVVIESARMGLWILIGTATFAILLNVPRMVAGVREVLAVSAENRAA
jgi:hypothetical protein